MIANAVQCEALEDRRLFALLGIVVNGVTPDVQSSNEGNNAITYTAPAIPTSSSVFQVNTTDSLLIEPGGAQDIITAPNGLTVKIMVDGNGNETGSAGPGIPPMDIDVEGTVTTQAGPTYSGTLLKGTISQFGYQFNNTIVGNFATFDFRFTATGGALDIPGYFAGQDIGMKVAAQQNAAFAASPFSANFDMFAAKADVVPVGRLVPQPAPPIITTVQMPATATIGSVVADQATVASLSGTGPIPTGTVTFNLYNNPTASGSPLFTDTETLVNGVATSANYTPAALGTDYWVDTYSGDTHYTPITSGVTAEPLTITQNTPAINTTPSASTTVAGGGAFATIGFWHNKNGQALITSFGGSLGTSLATAYPNLFGSPNPYISASLAGQSSSGVAAAYLGLWTPSGLTKNTYVQAFAVALGAFPGGGSSATFNVGSNGAAFGVPNGTTLSIGAILSAINANFNPATGLFYGGNQALTSAANNVLNGINVSGEQGGGGSTVTVNTLNDSATLSGGSNDTGTLTFYLMGPGSTASTPLSSAVYTDVVTVTGNGTYSTATQGTNAGGFNPTATGTYEWVVVYSGDTVNAPVTSAFGSEPWTVGQQNETFFTTPSTTSVVLGTSSVTLKDTATIQGGTNPTGTITWTLFLGATKLDTETVTVNGNGNYTTPTGYTIPTTGTVTGTYQWNATYSGDTNNAADSDNNDPSERTVVSAASPAIATVASESTSGDTTTVSDQAVLSGGVNPSGTITFSLYYNGGTTPLPGDTETVTVNGNGTYTTPTPIMVTAAGTYTWHAVYSGDSNNSTAIDNGQNESVTLAAPPVTAGEFATIGFWHNKNGQAVIYNFNGSSSATKLGNWLATNFPHLFGASNPYTGTSLAGLTNAQIGNVFLNLWNPSGVTKNTYVQAFAVALGIYADTSSLGGSSVSASYGFTVSATGGGSATYGLGNNGAAFPGLGSNPTVLQILEAVDANFNPTTGLFYGGNQTLTSDANNVLNGINTAGDI